ncbi:unnamed protein product [Symbiodinium sp. CCMP2592]|nr:unnamed protein product [Symbiodinium sp. CCMP2592]
MARHGEVPPVFGSSIAPAYGSDMLPDETASEGILKACREGGSGSGVPEIWILKPKGGQL